MSEIPKPDSDEAEQTEENKWLQRILNSMEFARVVVLGGLVLIVI